MYCTEYILYVQVLVLYFGVDDLSRRLSVLYNTDSRYMYIMYMYLYIYNRIFFCMCPMYCTCTRSPNVPKKKKKSDKILFPSDHIMICEVKCKTVIFTRLVGVYDRTDYITYLLHKGLS